MKNQEELIREHLESGRSITAVQALREYGVARLAARIHLLRKQGLNITDEWEAGAGRKKWKRYLLT